MRVKNLLALTLFCLCLLDLGGSTRVKRDDASFASDTGGPVAKSGKSDSGISDGLDQLNNQEDDLQPCELIGSQQQDQSILSTLGRKKRRIGNTNTAPDEVARAFVGENQKLFGPSKPEEPSPKLLVDQFDEFRKRFGKNYPPSFDLEKAAQIFEENKGKITELVNGRKSPFDAQIDVTKFTDENFVDFKKLHTGALPPKGSNDVRKLGLIQSLKIPKCQKLQWTEKNIFPAARNQGSCGSCYAMTTADLLAAQSRVEAKNWNNDLTPLSAQYIVDCILQPNAFKCDGGRPIGILNQMAACQKKGSPCTLPTESCYAYTGQNGTCKNSCFQQEIQIDGADMLNIEGSQEKDIMATLLQWGPVIAIVGVTETWQFYNGSGIIRPRQCTTDQAHAVLITGYDYTTCVPTYTVRNSWGTDWGARGYLKLEAGKNTCGVAQSVVYACSSKCDQNGINFDFVAQNPNFPGC